VQGQRGERPQVANALLGPGFFLFYGRRDGCLRRRPLFQNHTQTAVAGAAFPSAIAFTPGGSRLFYTERFTGDIRIYDLAAQALLPTPFATVEIFSTGVDERGLLGIAIDPEFATNHFVYVFHHPASNFGRITRFTDVDNAGVNPTIIADQIPAASIHNGGYLGFGPDGKLYLTVGENGQSSNAQDLTVVPGKLHRFNRDGTIPSDNPLPGSSIWSYGLRNSFGFSFHPVTGSLFLSEPGPTSNDEMNRIVKGGNYGWPTVLGCSGDGGFVDPLLAFTPVVTPNGSAVFSSNRYPPEFLHNLFFGEWNTGRIRRSVLAGNPDTKSGAPTAFLEPGLVSAVLDLKVGPDGNLWFSTPDSIGRIVYTISLALPALASAGTPAIGGKVIFSLLGNPGDTGFLVLRITGTSARKVISLGVIPALGVASTVVPIPADPGLAGQTIEVRGISVNGSGEKSLAGPLQLVILGSDPAPQCVATS